MALLATASAGDRVLMVDTVYGPVRHLAATLLSRLGIETVFFDPAVGAGIAELITPNTRVVYAEAPGSLTFEMLDLPAIAAAAHSAAATVIFDNSWATPLNFRPLDHGADISLMSATKYIVGHSDAIVGTVAVNAARWPVIKETSGALGTHVGPDDAYLTLRGLARWPFGSGGMLPARCKSRCGCSVNRESRAFSIRRSRRPGHTLFARDMDGGCGLLSLVFDRWDDARAAAFVDALKLFGIGVSWGGFESLAIVSHPAHCALRDQMDRRSGRAAAHRSGRSGGPDRGS